jgi:putative ABC transport system ATP-binding protein
MLASLSKPVSEWIELNTESVSAAPTPILQVRNLSKHVALPGARAQTLHILSDIEFTLERGAALAIIGASGSGKSTLLSLLAGLDTPSRGEIQFEGDALHALDEDARARLRARSVGFVFQNFQLLPALTALENVALPLELSGAREVRKASTEILQRVGLGDRLEHYPKQLSGGEQQRVAIARAFVTRPSILFADEPTGNLDARTGLAIMDLLFELNATAGTTLVLVTHDPRLAQRCHRQLVLEQGRIVSHAQVLKQRSGSTEQVLKQRSDSTEQMLNQPSGSTQQQDHAHAGN